MHQETHVGHADGAAKGLNHPRLLHLQRVARRGPIRRDERGIVVEKRRRDLDGLDRSYRVFESPSANEDTRSGRVLAQEDNVSPRQHSRQPAGCDDQERWEQ